MTIMIYLALTLRVDACIEGEGHKGRGVAFFTELTRCSLRGLTVTSVPRAGLTVI